LGVAALAHGLLLAPVPVEVRLVGALILFVGLPGWLFVQAVFSGRRPGPLERLLLALGAGYGLAMVLALLLYALVRPLNQVHLVVGADLLNGGLLLAVLARGAELRLRLGRPGWSLLSVLAIAAPFRLANLGYSEFQGDEAKVVLRSMAVLQGVPDALIAHRKPPGEVLLNALFAGGLDAVTELTGRLPFALAGLAGVLAIYHLGRTLFGPRAGLIAALLLAVNGYFVAFGRILQYQGVELLLETLALLCLFRFARGSGAERGYAIVGALLMAGAGLVALSAVFLLPVAALALWRRLFGPARAHRWSLALWLWPLALLVPSALVAYGATGAVAGETLGLGTVWSYLGPRLGEDRPYFNFERFLLSVNHYTSGLYLLVVVGLGALLVLADAVGGPVGSSRRSLGRGLALIWLIGPLVTHLLLVRIPWAHWREIFPALALLVGAAAVGLYGRLGNRQLRGASVLAGGLFLALSGHYVYTAWLRPWPEYQLLYPLYRHPLDWANVNAPRGGSILGATRHHGWKTVAELIEQGVLPADYASTDRPEAAWYLKRLRRCNEAASLYIRPPTTARDRRAIEQGETLPGFALHGRVYVDGRPTLALLTREPPWGGPRVYQDAGHGHRFDRELASPWWPVGRLYRPNVNETAECPRAG